MQPAADIPQLLARIALRDAAAMDTLYRRVGGRLLAIALRVLGDRSQAEDVLHEVMSALWAQRTPTLAAQPLSLAWLQVVTRNRAIDLQRRRRPEEPLQWVDASGEERAHDVASALAGPPEQLLERQIDARLAHCLEGLDAEPRRALLLGFLDGLSHPQISARLNRPLGMIKAWVRRALLRLRTCMDGRVEDRAP
ncbi:MAG: RNA polymerase sigma factor [Aquabacterium sp.]